MNTKQKLKKTALVKAVRRDDPYLTLGAARVESDKFWRWGDDNLFPTALALMSRRSTTHRRIINDKADYISGKGFTFDPEVPLLGAFVAQVNGSGESLRQVCSKLSFDKSLFGNAFLEVVTDEKHSFLALYHQDASRCRVARKATLLNTCRSDSPQPLARSTSPIRAGFSRSQTNPLPEM